MWPYPTTKQPDKITDISSISSRPNWFPRGMTSEGQAQKFRTDDVSLSVHSDWSHREGNLLQPIRSTTQIWAVRRLQYGISMLDPQDVGYFLRLATKWQNETFKSMQEAIGEKHSPS